MSRKNGSLAHQLEHAIYDSTAYGESRHRAKEQEDAPAWKIYSVGYKESLITVARDVGHFIRDRYPDCKNARDVKSYMLQAWLVDKSGTCGQETLSRYVSNLAKIDAACQHTYGCNMRTDRLSTPDSAVHTDPIRTHSATAREYTQLRDHFVDKQKTSDVWKSVVLSRCGGLRVKETVMVHRECFTFTGGKYGYGQINLRGKIDGTKNGRPRVVDILTREDRDAIASCCSGIKNGQTVLQNIRDGGGSMKPESITTALNRACKELGINKDWDWQKSHPFRKAFGQQCYDLARRETMDVMSVRDSRAAARAYVNNQMGHGEDRDDHTYTTYVAIRW